MDTIGNKDFVSYREGCP